MRGLWHAAAPTAGLLWGLSCGATGDLPAPTVCLPGETDAVFERRIRPLLEEDRPSSCNECHLSGIDLGLFVGDSECQSMACLDELGLVDLEDPDASVLLNWIERAAPRSELVTEDVIAAEREGVLAWIRIHARCHRHLCPAYADPCNEGRIPDHCELDDAPADAPRDPDPGDCADRTMETLFRDYVYRWRGRCFPCHDQRAPDVATEAPKWIADGPCNAGSLATLREVERRGFVDTTEPERSRLLLKPLSEEAGGLPHGGHAKFADPDDVAYRDILTFIERYADCNPSPAPGTGSG